MQWNRRDFIKTTMGVVAGGLSASLANAGASNKGYKISLAQWSIHKAIFGKKMDHLDFASFSREKCGVEAIEYVNQFFKDKAQDEKYLATMNQRAKDHGITQLLIMIDGEGALGDADPKKRAQAVTNHHRWVDAAKFLGCHSIRVNASSSGSYDDQLGRAAEGLARLTEYGAKHEINVIVENHGGLSSNGAWLAAVLKKVNHPRCGSLPDFGNFRVSNKEMYDRYKGVAELMPFAKAVSAKSHDFNEQGDEIHTDYMRMMKIVMDAGYHGYVGIEYEGGKIGELEGIIATRKLLERVREKLTS